MGGGCSSCCSKSALAAAARPGRAAVAPSEDAAARSIPRLPAWATSSGARRLALGPEQRSYKELLAATEREGTLPREVLATIANDVPRTFFPGLAPPNDGEARVLERLLRALAVWDPEVAYCQGINFLAAFALAAAKPGPGARPPCEQHHVRAPHAVAPAAGGAVASSNCPGDRGPVRGDLAAPRARAEAWSLLEAAGYALEREEFDRLWEAAACPEDRASLDSVLQGCAPGVAAEDEEDTFWLVACLLRDYGARGLFLPNTPVLKLYGFCLSRLLQKRLPEFHHALAGLDAVLGFKWFGTLFTTVLPREAALRVWDVIFRDGLSALLALALGFCSLIAPALAAAATEDFEAPEFMGLLQRRLAVDPGPLLPADWSPAKGGREAEHKAKKAGQRLVEAAEEQRCSLEELSSLLELWRQERPLEASDLDAGFEWSYLI